jgi:diguanylate cyclase (GGDEF)-like protein
LSRNAQKRRERRKAKARAEHAERMQAQVQRVAAEEMEEAPPPKPVWAQALEVAHDHPLDEAGLDRLLFHVAAGLAAGSGDLSERLGPVAKQLAHWLPADTVTVALDGDDGALEVAAMHAKHDGDGAALAGVLSSQVLNDLVDARELVRVDDVPRDARFAGVYGQRSHVGSLMIVPFVASLTNDGRRGVLLVTRKESRGFPDTAEHLLDRLARALGRDLARVARLREVFLCPTTGLRSRAGLLVDLPLWIARARRRGRSISVILLEVRNLREIAAEYGADAEHIVIRELGDRLREHTRFADAVTRFGRASFVLVAPAEYEETAPGADRLQAILSAPVSIADADIPLNVREGVAELGPDDDAFDLLAAADAALIGGSEPVEIGEEPEAPGAEVDRGA